ncbi:hypothetical protein Tco_0755971 [Tanacetum coccineum]
MSLDLYNSIRRDKYEYRGVNFVGIGRHMHVFVGNMSHVLDFTILQDIEENINPELSHVVFERPFVESSRLTIDWEYGLMTVTDEKDDTLKTPYDDPEWNDLSSESHDLLSSKIILAKMTMIEGVE